MYFRFGSGLLLMVLISLGGIALEKRKLELHRRISKQQFQLAVLLEKRSQLRLETQQLSAPVRLARNVDDGNRNLVRPETVQTEGPRKQWHQVWQWLR